MLTVPKRAWATCGITPAIRTDEMFFFERKAAAARTYGNFSDQMTQSFRTVSHRSRTNEKRMANDKRTVFRRSNGERGHIIVFPTRCGQGDCLVCVGSRLFVNLLPRKLSTPMKPWCCRAHQHRLCYIAGTMGFVGALADRWAGLKGLELIFTDSYQLLKWIHWLIQTSITRFMQTKKCRDHWT